MTLTKGQKLGPYEILDAAGAGGMGEVYKAKDTRLDRTVAIKILPAHTASNPDVRARFEREAKAISSLNHSAICTLHDIGREGDVDYLVMEFIQGESLADRISQGPLGTSEAMEIAIEVADALDAAHRQGLIHRDLKPGNVMLTKDGAKLLDFGLAKLVMPTDKEQEQMAATATTPITGTGTIVGTLQYMSPEQIEGKEADARSDIFAFGAMLYEMLTGKRAFTGDSQTGIIASILKERPQPVSDINKLVPPALDRLIHKCLEKNPDARWQSARDLADELRWLAASGSQPGIPAPVAAGRRRRARLGWLIAGAAVVAVLALTYVVMTMQQQSPSVRRFEISTADAGAAYWPRLSPDGTQLVYRAVNEDGDFQIWHRSLDQLEARKIPGTVGAQRPFWSPDSRWIAFFQGQKLKRMLVSGGPAQTICDQVRGADGSWGNDDVILFDGFEGDVIQMVPATGGSPSPVTHLQSGEQSHAWPWFLPDGRHFLYTVDDNFAQGTIGGELRVGSIDSDETKNLIRVDSRVEYTELGYIAYVRDGILLVRQFDADALELVGTPIPLDEHIYVRNLGANFSLAGDGTLAYQKRSSTAEKSLLVWVDRSGRPLDTLGEQDNYRDITLSPDGKEVAFSKIDSRSGKEDVWLYDLRRDVASRFTFYDGIDVFPAWSLDGEWVLFTSDRNDRHQIFRKRSDGSGGAEVVYSNPEGAEFPGVGTWNKAGDSIYIWYLMHNWGMGEISLEGGTDPGRLDTTDYAQYPASRSPDGNYLAYASTESGGYQVFVRRLTGEFGKWQISTDGGWDPLWSHDGREIFYQKDDSTVMTVPVSFDGGFKPGRPEELFRRDIQQVLPKAFRIQPAADGQRFLINQKVAAGESSGFVVVLNWLADERFK